MLNYSKQLRWKENNILISDLEFYHFLKIDKLYKLNNNKFNKNLKEAACMYICAVNVTGSVIHYAYASPCGTSSGTECSKLPQITRKCKTQMIAMIEHIMTLIMTLENGPVSSLMDSNSTPHPFADQRTISYTTKCTFFIPYITYSLRFADIYEKNNSWKK